MGNRCPCLTADESNGCARDWEQWGTRFAELEDMEENAPAPNSSSSAEDLCYLSADHVKRPGGTLADLELCNGDYGPVGTVDGVLIDAPGRRVRYFVVNFRPYTSRFLLPVEDIVRVDSDKIRAGLETPSAPLRLTQFDPRAVRPFSDDDAITAMFTPRNRRSRVAA